MVMVVDVSQSLVEFSELKEQLASKEKKWACKLLYSMRIYSNTCTAFRNRDRLA